MFSDVLVAVVVIVLGAVPCSLVGAAGVSDNGVRAVSTIRRLWQPPTEQISPLREPKISLGCGDRCKKMRGAYTDARDQLELHWSTQWSEDLPCNSAKPEYVGFKNKLGYIAESPTMGLVPWLIPRSFTANLFPIYFNCMVYVSDNYKFVFIRQPKSSSTSVMHGLEALFCDGPFLKGGCTSEQFRRVVNPRMDISRAQWKEYFVFTVVRNPWTRMLSAYNMFNEGFLHSYEADKKPGNSEVGEPCGLPFIDFAADSANMVDICSAQGCCPVVRDKFRDNIFTYMHISEQQHCAFLPDGTSMVDYIGTTETLGSDWDVIVDEISKRTGGQLETAALYNSNGQGKASSGGVANDCSFPHVRAALNETTLHNIAWQYALDVQRFGYM